MGRLKWALAAVLSAFMGFILAGAVFHRAVQGPAAALPPPRNPFNPKELAGLIGSAGLTGLGGHLNRLPFVALETDETVVLDVSPSRDRVHYVLVPKRDLKDIGEFSAEYEESLLDVFRVARQCIEKEKLSTYRFYTNGPGHQTVAYWHFHLAGRRDDF